MNKRLVFWIKLLLTLAVIGFIGYEVAKNAAELRHQKFTVDPRFILASFLAFAAFMIQSALVWHWLARRMGDRTRTLPAIGAYVYSQMGKYVPGKVALLLMRVGRANRIGMDPQICIVATLIENAMYMVSGAMIAIVTLAIYAQDKLHPDQKLPVFSALSIGLVAMCTVFHPRIFYSLVNRLLRKMKRPEVPPAIQLRIPHMIGAVLGFIPCWILGGLSLWCATRAVHIDVPPPAHAPTLADFATFPGTVSFAVVGGMAFLTPGGVGPREFIMGLFLYPVVGQSWATLAVVLQRLVQISCEIILGIIGAALTRNPHSSPNPNLNPQPESVPLTPTPPASPAPK